MTSKERIQRLNVLKLEVKRLKGEIRNVEREKDVINQEFYEEAPFKIGDKVLYTKHSLRIKKGEEKELVYIVTGWNFNLPYNNTAEGNWDDYLYEVNGQPEYTFYLAKMKKDGTPSEFNGDKIDYVNTNTLKKVE